MLSFSFAVSSLAQCVFCCVSLIGQLEITTERKKRSGLIHVTHPFLIPSFFRDFVQRSNQFHSRISAIARFSILHSFPPFPPPPNPWFFVWSCGCFACIFPRDVLGNGETPSLFPCMRTVNSSISTYMFARAITSPCGLIWMLERKNGELESAEVYVCVCMWEGERERENREKEKRKKKKTIVLCMPHLIVQNKRINCELREFEEVGRERRTRGDSTQSDDR